MFVVLNLSKPVAICYVTVYISGPKDSNYLMILWYFFSFWLYFFNEIDKYNILKLFYFMAWCIL